MRHGLHDGGQGPRSSVNVRVGSSSCSVHEAGHKVTVVVPGTRVTKKPNSSSPHGPGSTCCRRCGRPPSIPTRSTIFSPGFSTVTIQEHTPGSKVHVQLRHGHLSPKRSEQTVNDGQPVSTAAQGRGSSPGVQAMMSLSRESTAMASSPPVAPSSASNVSALASWVADGGCLVSLEQEKCRATIDFVARNAQEKRRGRDRAEFTSDLCSAKEWSAQTSVQTWSALNGDRTRAK
jgi:hypothetical protein